MTTGAYLFGLVVLAAIVVPLGVAARAVARRFVPEWSGPLAWLAQAVVLLGLLMALAQGLGALGLLDRAPLVLAAWVVAGGTVAAAGHVPAIARTPVDWGARLRRPGRDDLVTVLLLALAITPWLAGAVVSYRNGVGGYDSLNYHLPFAGRFAQTGSVTPLVFVLPGLDQPFYPVNAELVHALGMVALGHDVLSPVVNLGWLVLALLSGWCVGLRRQVPVATLAATVVLVTTPLFVSTNAGRAVNDLAGMALLLAAVALLLNGERRRSAIAIAAVASGLAIATKASLLAPVALLTMAVLLVGGRRRAAALTWLPLLVVTGGFWYARNVLVTGSPFPTLPIGVGPVSLPSASLDRSYPATPVVRYLADMDVWRTVFLPGVRSSFGVAWVLVLGLAVAGAVLALRRGDRLERALGAVALLSLVAYTVTPISAGGTATTLPILFARNLRFAYPGLALGLVLLPLSWSGALARRWGPVLLGVALVGGGYYTLTGPRGATAAAVAIVVAVAALGLGVAWAATSTVVRARWSRPARLTAAAALVAVGLVALGSVVQTRYLSARYAPGSDRPFASAPPEEVETLFRWVAGTTQARVGVAGFGFEYPLLGEDLSNRVEYVGRRGPHGAFDDATTCREWRTLVNDGRYDYVVVSIDGKGDPLPPQLDWTRGDPSATEVRDAPGAGVFRIDGALDPDAC